MLGNGGPGTVVYIGCILVPSCNPERDVQFSFSFRVPQIHAGYMMPPRYVILLIIDFGLQYVFPHLMNYFESSRLIKLGFLDVLPHVLDIHGSMTCALVFQKSICILSFHISPYFSCFRNPNTHQPGPTNQGWTLGRQMDLQRLAQVPLGKWRWFTWITGMIWFVCVSQWWQWSKMYSSRFFLK